jgi:hypothetical protein
MLDIDVGLLGYGVMYFVDNKSRKRKRAFDQMHVVPYYIEL